MDNLLSGAIGGIIGTILSSLVSYYLFRKQILIDSNRSILNEMNNTVRNIYVKILQGNIIEEHEINFLISFQVIGFKEFKNFHTKLEELKKAILNYNEGVNKSIQTTNTSTLQITYKTDAELKLKELVEIMRKLT